MHFELMPVNEETGEIEFSAKSEKPNLEADTEDMTPAEFAVYQQQLLDDANDDLYDDLDFEDLDDEEQYMDDLTHEENLAISNAEMAYEDLVEEMSSYGVSD